MIKFGALALWYVVMHGTFRDPRVPAAAAGRAGRTSVYGMVTCGQLDNMVRPEAMHCTIRPWQVAGAVPRTGAASVLALGVAAIDSGPATLVLGHKAGAILNAAAERASDVEAVNESLGLVPNIDTQALAGVDAGALRENADGRGMRRPRLVHTAHSPEVTATAPPVVGPGVELAGVGNTSNVVPDLIDTRLYAVNRSRRLAFGAHKLHTIDELLSLSGVVFQPSLVRPEVSCRLTTNVGSNGVRPELPNTLIPLGLKPHVEPSGFKEEGARLELFPGVVTNTGTEGDKTSHNGVTAGLGYARHERQLRGGVRVAKDL